MKVLVADDQPSNLKLLQVQFEAEGHEVLPASDGLAALEALKRGPVDALITDILMPRMDGYRLCYEVRTHSACRDLPIIFYTATYTSPADEKLAHEVGADAYLRKPAPVEKILEVLDDVVRSGRPHAPAKSPDDLAVLKEHSERLVTKLHEKNFELMLQGAAVDTTANAVVIADVQGVILWTNPAFTTLTGYTAAEALGRNPRFLKSGRHDRVFYRELWQRILAGETWRGRLVNRRKDGGTYYGDQTITPVRSADGTVTHFVAVMNDVTARTLIEAELRSANALLHHLHAHSPAVTYRLVRREGSVTLHNVSGNVETMLGFSAAEMSGGDWWSKHLHPDDRHAALAQLTTGRTDESSRTQYRLRHRDGSYRWIEDERQSVPGGATGEFVGEWNDITERKRADEVLEAWSLDQPRRPTMRRVGLELAIVALSCVAVFVVGHRLEIFDHLFRLDEALHPYADETFGTGLFLSLAMLVFSYRRWREAETEVNAQKQIAGALRCLHTDVDFKVRQRTAELHRQNDVLNAEVEDRRKAERALRLFRAQIDHANDVIEVLDPETGRFLDVNAKGPAELGCTREEFLAQSLFDVDPTIRREDWPGYMARMRVVGVTKGEGEHRRKDGTSFPVEFSARFIRLDRDYIVAGVRDITERKRAEAALAEQREQWRSLVTVSASAVFVVQDERVVFANPALARLVRWTEAELQNCSVFELLHEDYHDIVRARIAQSQLQDEPLPLLQSKYRRRDGAMIDVESTSVGFRFHGRPAQLVEARDISKRKRAELRLALQYAVVAAVAEAGSPSRANRRILEAVCQHLGWEVGELWTIEHATSLLRCTDTWHAPDAALQAFNDRAAGFTLAVDQGLPGAVWQSARPQWSADVGADPRFMRAALARAAGLHGWIGIPIMARQQVVAVAAFFHRRAELPDEETLSLLFAIGVQLSQFIEHQQLAEQFRQAQKMDAIGTLAGGIAHDFNNIIAAISGYGELAKMDLSGNAAAAEHLDAILKGTQRAAALVRQIMAFSRQQEHKRAPIQLRHVVAEALELLRASIPTTVVFEKQLARDLPTVLADATQVHQVVMNLCTNAWHAMRESGGELRVTLEALAVDDAFAELHVGLRPGPYVRLSVADTGHGMDAATLARVFEPFFTTKKPGEGTGLGLAVVHGIVQSHDGVVTVQSQPGQGATFRLYFPAIAVEQAKSDAGEGASIPPGHGQNVLYVDDEEPLARMGQRVLQRLGYRADGCTSAEEALRTVRAAPDRYQLVITDLTMPGLTGVRLAEELHTIRADLPIILVTGHSATLTAGRVREMGLRDLLLKPVSIRALGVAVAQVLANDHSN